MIWYQCWSLYCYSWTREARFWARYHSHHLDTSCAALKSPRRWAYILCYPAIEFWLWILSMPRSSDLVNRPLIAVPQFLLSSNSIHHPRPLLRLFTPLIKPPTPHRPATAAPCSWSRTNPWPPCRGRWGGRSPCTSRKSRGRGRSPSSSGRDKGVARTSCGRRGPAVR